MRVTKGQRDAWGGDLAAIADFLDVDETGVQVTLSENHHLVKLAVDSTTTTGAKRAYLEADDALGVGWLLIQRAMEAKGADFELVARAWLAARRRAADIGDSRDIPTEVLVTNLVNAFRTIDAAIGIRT